ncbi:hypothetical protein VTN49DRAFT_5627 [Thermomyces lanuginosus]|uniref:uncharacterized protein n=1 Tax=Thermomyces lanuginosus TaxID=5541 RepID=UPI0037449BA4
MDNRDVHAPTVPSGPTTARSGFPDLSKLGLFELMNEKDRIEAELRAYSSVLTSHGVTMETPLTTPDGFPRNDIDVAQIRYTRVRIIHLRNDHKEVMKHLETKLHEHFASLRESGAASTTSSDIPLSATESRPPVETPFARVNSVADGSPAAEAGLKAGDIVRTFGSVNWVNHERLRKVGEVVQQNEGRPLVVKVTRKSEDGEGTRDISLILTPRRDWGGRGLLGCHLVPL